MVNLTYQELVETQTQALPSATLETLKRMREDLCSTKTVKFKLQPAQRFLRRVMSPDSPVRNLLMVHGAGGAKTCSAIQIAEEYIIRPEFQDKRVLILANPSIQENFKTQLFDISRVSVDKDGLVMSQQCTGRKYLDMIQRMQNEPLSLTDKSSQERIMNIASKILNEFYEFRGYGEFANMVESNKNTEWVSEKFDNRLIIVDEAHNLRETSETETTKLTSSALEYVLKNAKGITLVLLTATPMYDTYDELIYYFNLFLWNDRRIDLKKSIKTSDIFNDMGEFNEGKETVFRSWCQDYISYLKGDNPFTFPFRLPPPTELIADVDRTTDVYGKKITFKRKYLALTQSIVSPYQAEAIRGLTPTNISEPNLLCVFPDKKPFRETFEKTGESYSYKGIKFLSPSTLETYSSKYSLIMKILNESKGVVFVYSNLVEVGAKLFSMVLEEHGYEPAVGNRLLQDTSGEVNRGSKGKYVLFTSETNPIDIRKALIRLRNPKNKTGSDIRIIVASPKVSEGVDFRFVRQVHVLDPWFNMSRIEQVVGRGIRTCSHSALPFEEQNCTIYLHICRFPDSKQETLDEYIYRTFAEGKAIRIAKVKRVIMESAMDCPLQSNINVLPQDWRTGLKIPQIRSQDGKELSLTLFAMSSPTFEESIEDFTCKIKESTPDELHERPLSAILDVKDEVLDSIIKIIIQKPIWNEKDFYSHELMKNYSEEVISYILQTAIESGFRVKDKYGRLGHLESKDGLIVFSVGSHDTLQDRILKPEEEIEVSLKVVKKKEEEVTPQKIKDAPNIDAKRDAMNWGSEIKERFSTEVLNWHIVDNELTVCERLSHFLSLNWESPPIYATNLRITLENGKHLYVLGSKKIYNDDKEKIEPIGEEKDEYNKWITSSKERFLAKKDELFASMKSGNIVFNLDDKSKEIRKAPRSKTIGGRACTSYTEDILNTFAKWLHGDMFPENVSNKKNRCLFIDLLVREAILSKKEGIFWITPEEFEIYQEDEHRSFLLKQLG